MIYVYIYMYTYTQVCLGSYAGFQLIRFQGVLTMAHLVLELELKARRIMSNGSSMEDSPCGCGQQGDPHKEEEPAKMMILALCGPWDIVTTCSNHLCSPPKSHEAPSQAQRLGFGASARLMLWFHSDSRLGLRRWVGFGTVPAFSKGHQYKNPSSGTRVT